MNEQPKPPPAPLVCPACRLLKDGSGLLCAYCHRQRRIEAEETRNVR